MKSQRTEQKRVARWLSTVLLFGVTLTLMLPAGAWAVGTASGTSIANQATITYDVGSVGQPAIQSDGDAVAGGAQATTFVVDNLVDVAVSTLDAAIVDVTPGASAMVLRFQVDNEGNTTQDFLLSAAGQADGSGPHATPFGSLMDAFDADTGTNPIRFYTDSAAVEGPTATYTPGTWDGTGTETLVTHIDELDADNSVTVYIVMDIPAGQTDGDMAIYGLLAQVAAGGGAGAQGAAIAADDSGSADTAGVDIVFGDAVGADDPDQVNPDGRHSSRSVFRIASATLAATKNTAVVWDPINAGTNPKAIPGARVAYTITVDNTGSTQADNVVITDHIMQFTTDVTFVSGSASATNTDGGVTPVIEYSADGSTWNAAETSPVNYVRATNSSIQATTGQATLVFQVTIN